MDFRYDSELQLWESVVLLPCGPVSFRLPGSHRDFDRRMILSAQEVVREWHEIAEAMTSLTNVASKHAPAKDALEIASLVPIAVEFHGVDLPSDWDIRLVGDDPSRLWICEFGGGQLYGLVEQVIDESSRTVERRLVWEYEALPQE